MRLLLLALGTSIAVFAANNPADAQNYPWCSQYSGRGGGAMNCGFSTFEQCMANVSGIGGFCIRNTLYVPPGEAPAVRHRSRKHKQHPS